MLIIEQKFINDHEFGQTHLSVTRVNLFFNTHDAKEADMKTLCTKEADTNSRDAKEANMKTRDASEADMTA